MPRDYLHRRRTKRRLTNAIVIGVLSAAIGWAITRQAQNPPFSIHGLNQSGNSAAFRNGPDTGGLASGNYQAAQGHYLVQEIGDAALHDAVRDVDLHLRLLFPKNAGRFPIIIFSPDDRESQDCCEELIRHWASHGYAVVLLTRAAALDSGKERTGTSLQTVALKHAIRDRPGIAVPGTRILDVTSVIDSLETLQTGYPALRRKLDDAHIGVAGRGAGAVVAEAIGGAALNLPGRPGANLADPRVRAVLCISPQGPGKSGLTEHSFEQLVLPYLGITGERAAAPPKLAAAAGPRMPFERSQPGDKYNLLIRGTDAPALAREESNDVGESASMYIRAATLAFWDAYLKHDVAARRYLQSDALEKGSRGALAFERR